MFLTIYKSDLLRNKSVDLSMQNPSNNKLIFMPNSKKLSEWYKKEISYYEDKIYLAEKYMDFKCLCSKGCYHCCKQAIGITKSEAMAMLPIIKNLSDNEKKEIKIKTINVCNVLNGSDVIINNALKKGCEEDYFKLDLLCPLNINGNCIAYSCRPTICWSYRCYSEPSQCKDKFNPDGSVVFKELFLDMYKKLYISKAYINDDNSILPLLPFALKEFVIDNI